MKRHLFRTGVELDPDRNRKNAEVIPSDRSAVRVFVIQTNEELMVAHHTAALLVQAALAMHQVARPHSPGDVAGPRISR